MVNLPYRLKGLTIYPAFGKIELSENMTKVECLEAQKIYSDIQWVEEVSKPKKKRR